MEGLDQEWTRKAVDKIKFFKVSSKISKSNAGAKR